MYVSYLLDKEVPMYSSSVRHSGGLNLAAQNFVSAPQYPDYGGYHVAAAGVNLDSAQSQGPSWPSPYGAPLRDDWNGYGQGGPATAAASAVHGLNGGSPAAALAYSPADYHHHHHHHPGPAPHAASGLSPGGQRRNLCEWMRKPTQPALGVKTRTKDKYRVVYTDHQRLELEKEFHYSRYITIRRKAELAATLGLSERQVKIWFQNRRAKERKINKKKLQQSQPGAVHSGSQALSPVSSLQGSTGPGPAGVLQLGISGIGLQVFITQAWLAM
uniref:Homeobox domain-containing protein n=1 Tax=Terrapene triunguis TaxID=2587831 RepID=A0A674IHR1_9SAUR